MKAYKFVSAFGNDCRRTKREKNYHNKKEKERITGVEFYSAILLNSSISTHYSSSYYYF